MAVGDDRLAHWRNVPWDDRFMIWAHPVCIVADRYGGTYSGGAWVAIASTGGDSRRAMELVTLDDREKPSPWASDIPARTFWNDPPLWIASGETPEAALAALKDKNRDMNWPFDEQSRIEKQT